MKTRLALIFVLNGFAVLSAPAATFTNAASADVFVRANAPTLNYGAAGALSVSGPNATNGLGAANGASDSFIRFNSTAMVTSFNTMFGPDNWVISRAKLRVTEMGAPANNLFNRGVGRFEIRWIAHDTWLEGTGSPNIPTTSGLTYNDEATLLNGGTDASLGIFTNAGIDATWSFSLALPVALTADLQAGGEVGLYLTAIDPGIGFTISSRNFGTTTARPYLEISAVPRPVLAAINVSGTDLVLAGNNGAAGETYHVLTSPNAATPLLQWTALTTNVLPGNGNFTLTLTNAVNSGSSSPRFFILQVQ